MFKETKVHRELKLIFFWFLLLLLLLFYNSYRYFFSFNMHTATTIPLLWKVLKFVLLLACLLPIYVANAPRFRIYRSGQFIYLSTVCLYILVINGLSYAIYDVIIFDEFEYVIYFFLLLPLSLFPSIDLLHLSDKVSDMLVTIGWFVVLGNCYVYANYLLFNRLPAHAYVGSLVRFGGLWDDPNGFAFFCVFLFFPSWKRKKFFLCFGLLISIIFAFSFTSYILFFASIAYWMYIGRFKMKVEYYGMILVSGLFLLAIWAWFISAEDIEYFKGIVEAKSGSLEAHEKLLNLNFHIIPILDEGVQFSETWLLSFLINYMPLSPFMLIVFFLFVIKLLRQRKDSIFIYYIIIFVVGMLFLPMLYVFPLNFIFLFFLILHFKCKC